MSDLLQEVESSIAENLGVDPTQITIQSMVAGDESCTVPCGSVVACPSGSCADGSYLPYDEDKNGVVDVEDLMGMLSYFNVGC